MFSEYSIPSFLYALVLYQYNKLMCMQGQRMREEDREEDKD